MTTKTCPVCWERFKSATSKRKYCSLECKATAWSKRSGRDYDEVLESLKEQENKRTKQKTRYGHGAPCAWRCHDCGRKTDLYRCPDCKAKWLKKHGVAPCEEDAHDDAYRVIF